MLPKSEEFKLAMSAVRARIAAAKRRGTHSGMIDYSGCIYICDELVRIVNETDSLISDGKYRLAFSIDLLVLTNCAKLASTGDSSSGCLNDAVYYTNEAIAKIGSSVLPDRDAAQFIYLSALKESRNKAYDGWSEFVYDLLKCTATLATAENVGKLYALLDEMRDEQAERPYDTYRDLDCQVRYEALKATEGTAVAAAFVGDHLQYDGVRRIAIDNAVSGKEYDTAEKLCRERIAVVKGYTQAFPSQNQECLLTGMQRIFEHIGGVPPRLRFDNMTTAVAQVLEGTERVLTDGFMRFKLHYRFQADFCNPRSGNEKGNVENKVGYSRRNAFVPVPTITSFENFNESLWNWCEKDAERSHYKYKVSIQELWREEQGNLLALPEYPFPVFRYKSMAVNKYGFAVIDTNKYGLAPSLYGETVQAKIFYDRVEFFHDHQPVGKYRRCYGSNEEIYDWTQYVATLCKKPGAIEHTRFFHQMPQPWQQHLEQSHGKDRKSALQLLQEIVRDGNAALCDDVLELAGMNGRTDADSMRQCYYMIAKKEYRPEPLKMIANAPALNYNPNLSAYDGLMVGGKAHG